MKTWPKTDAAVCFRHTFNGAFHYLRCFYAQNLVFQVQAWRSFTTEDLGFFPRSFIFRICFYWKWLLLLLYISVFYTKFNCSLLDQIRAYNTPNEAMSQRGVLQCPDILPSDWIRPLSSHVVLLHSFP